MQSTRLVIENYPHKVKNSKTNKVSKCLIISLHIPAQPGQMWHPAASSMCFSILEIPEANKRDCTHQTVLAVAW
jgi:hypothetical protein